MIELTSETGEQLPRKACQCGAVWTDEKVQIWCEKCKTFTHPVYVKEGKRG